jgi:hypothetical protein
MKQNILVASSLLLTIVVSSFKVNSTVDIYYIYNGGADHSDPTNYSTTISHQPHIFGTAHLRWIMIRDDDGTVTCQEFCDMYDALDRSIPQNTNLDDDTEGFVVASPPYVYQLEKGN